MSEQSIVRNDEAPADLDRRRLCMGVVALVGGGLAAAAKTAEAFPPGSRGHFTAASQILGRYGVRVVGDESEGHDLLTFETAPLPTIEYGQVVGPRGSLGEIVPCIKTSVYGDDASFTHFHPGEIVPCVKTTIEGHTLATTEIFDAGWVDAPAGLPSLTLSATMQEGGVIGTVEVNVNRLDQDLVVRVGDRTYRLADGELVLEPRGAA